MVLETEAMLFASALETIDIFMFMYMYMYMYGKLLKSVILMILFETTNVLLIK